MKNSVAKVKTRDSRQLRSCRSPLVFISSHVAPSKA
jgi:hypothetical protein